MEKKESLNNRIKQSYRLECSKLTALFGISNGEESVLSKEKMLELLDIDVSVFSKEELVKHANFLLDNYMSGFSYILPNSILGRFHGYLSINVNISKAEWRFFFVPKEEIAYKIEFVDKVYGDKLNSNNGRIAMLLWQRLYISGIPDIAYSSNLVSSSLKSEA